jgi:hypothetical protein
MNISDLHSAKGLKFKLKAENGISSNLNDTIVNIINTSGKDDFFVECKGNRDLFTAEKNIANHISELLEAEKNKIQKNLFVVDDAHDDYLEIQSYSFASITEYKTTIAIQVSETLLEKNTADKLNDIFVYNGIGLPAIFALRYRDQKKTDIRLLSGNRFLNIKKTPRGLIAVKIDSKRDRSNLPIDVYLAPKIEFVRETDNAKIDGTFAHDLDKISNAATYFSRWEAYNDLAKKEIDARKEEFGKVEYTRYTSETIENGIRFIFDIKDMGEKSYSVELMGESLAVQGAKTDKRGQAQDVWVGKIISISNDKIKTELEREDAIVSIPASGKLVLSDFGDRAIIRRREKAKDRMIGHRSPIKGIVPLIEIGVSEFSSENNWTDNKAITAELERNFKQAKLLNAQQKKALELAINTPDIALIQGPPGTGKTTVIKAIRERFREIFERDHDGERPRILISSFQHEAVDNAISDPLPGELPACREGKKSEEKYKKSVMDWVSKVNAELTQYVGNNEHLAFGPKRKELSDDYFVYKSTGEKPEDGIRLMEKYLSIPGINYHNQLKEFANKIIEQYRKQGVSDITLDEDPFVKLLREQRLTKESFADDGENKVKRLCAHLRIRSDLEIEKKYIEAINSVAGSGINDENMFKAYIESIKALIKKYVPETERSNTVKTNQIDKCIQELAIAFYNERLNTTDNLEDKKAIVIGEFLERFEDDTETLIDKYSLTTAATCQQSMPLYSRNEESYDMVIVDEAARATPLDLFIPMSMGRKIILVGDHKQLPHMLEPDVLKLILDDPQYKDLPQLDISLFERLFSMFDSGIRPKAIPLDTQYRMHPDICSFVSEAFYDNRLKSGITAEDRVIPQEIFGGKALVYINVTKNQGEEYGRASKARSAEVNHIAEDIKKLVDKCPDITIGVITFYSAQRDELTNKIREVLNDNQYSRVEIGTVDAFQGKEFDYVFLSCVRSNNHKEEKHSVGFLVKPNRICVALSRAKYQLAVYADAETINKVECFKLLYKKCKENKEGYYHEC